jgi:hypothetical protein
MEEREMEKPNHEAWKRLGRKMKEIGHGEIRDLRIKDGVPVLGSPIGITKDRLLKPGSGACSKKLTEDNLKHANFQKLISDFRGVGEANISVLKIQDGIPFRIIDDGITSL